MRYSLLLLAGLVGCSGAELVEQTHGFDISKTKKALNIEICDDHIDNDKDGLVDEDCDEDDKRPGKPPSFGSSSGEGPNGFIPWDDDFFFERIETDDGDLYIARGGESDTDVMVGFDLDQILRAQEGGSAEEVDHGAILRFEVSDGIHVEYGSGYGRETWVLLADFEHEQAWALNNEGALDVATLAVEEDRRRR